MTIAKTAREIVEEFAQGDVTLDQLETAILRHMEHHMVRAAAIEREACAKVAEDVLAECGNDTHDPTDEMQRFIAREIMGKIRARKD